MHQMLTRRASETNPLRSLPLLSHPARIFGWTPIAKAREQLAQAERGIPVCVARYDQACAALGRANRCAAPGMRRMQQSDAMRRINMQRKQLLDAHRELAERRAEVKRLENEPELPFPPSGARPAIDPDLMPSAPRILRDANGRWPARTVGAVEKCRGWGYAVTITRPHGAGGMVSTFETREAARAWLDAEFTPAVVH